MKLLEILHTVEDEQKSNLINVDEWKFADSEHLKDMGFELEGDYHYKLDNPPMTVYQQKSPQVQEGQKGSFFVIDEPKKGKRAFRNFTYR